ncbi:Cystinosin/ERS1p repeat protein [Beauveria brongniartii RCEF 3172]|uniref:Cystinosin/ERS1p repeat protein n=1 Tax=Beauveria brongniartii RCEF 3172 TaxID=1081107 RepID=A0A167JAA6_9HYPO|nr:Cystinosin/ERS1p repeat protein [Beauveria brongniartii RCEF 3172]
MPTGIKLVSAVIGWAYTLCWGVSFYPLLLSNIRRRSTEGVSIDFCLLNMLGMAAYATYNVVFFFSPVVRRQYAERNPENPTPMVQPNDVAYTLHGLAISSTIYSQFYPRLWGFYTTRPVKISLWCSMTFWASILAALLGILAASAFPDSQSWMWLDVLYLVGNFKTLLTLLKYLPQVWLNYRRKSTQGFPPLPFALDIGGATLSLLQLLIDVAYSDQSAALANPVKLVLSNLLIFFDAVLLCQRFVLYRDAVDELDSGWVAERRQLLESEDDETHVDDRAH